MSKPGCETCRWRELREDEAAPGYRCLACTWRLLEYRQDATLWEPRRWWQKVGDFFGRGRR